MTHNDRVQASASIALLAALLAAVWAWRTGLDAESLGWLAGGAYGAVVVFLAPALHAPTGAVAVTSIKYAALTAAFSVWVAAAGTYAIVQLLRGRAASTPKGAFV